jgi:hypothetical protein
MQVRNLAFGQREETHSQERETLEEAGGVLLIAAETVQRLGEDDVEFAIQGAAHQRLKSWSQQRRSRNGVVVEFARNRPSFAFREQTAQTNLIRDRRLALIVG